MRLRAVVLALAGVLFVGACSQTGAPTAPLGNAAAPSRSHPSSPSAFPTELTIAAAASLSKALEKVSIAYQSAHPGAGMTVSTDSSATLETQIEQGAPVDVFLSADTTNPKKLVEGGFADGDAVVFAGNKLTIITPKDDPGGLTSPFDLAKAGVRIVAAGDDVPITRYATTLVEHLAAAPGAPAGFAAAYDKNVVSKEDNVSAVRSKIELGEGDAAIVYVTDAAASDKVGTIEIPDALNVPASYAGVVVKASAQHAAAHAFLDWLRGPDGRSILDQFGFLPPAA
ncbi:MAG TPA: molybdate ABC transporter substrate-binding protein [Candidatus Limnocylindrales bacterium]|nr:molybdate ABC transporter substrate-binding protein [Candidatus Limnocylindrales bacterium]